MKNFGYAKKVLALIAICFCVGRVYGVDILWNSATTYTIPADGNTYYMDFVKSLTANFSVAGTFEMRSGANLASSSRTISVLGGTFTVKSGAILKNGENFVVSSGDFVVEGSIDNGLDDSTGTITISGGTMTVSGGTIIQGIELAGEPGESDAIGNITLTSGEVDFASGTITNGHRLNATGNITISGGTFRFGGGFTISEGSGDSNVTIFGLNLDGVANPINNGEMIINSGKSMTIASGDTLEIKSGGTLIIFGSLTEEGTLINNGTLHDFRPNNISIGAGETFIIPSESVWDISTEQALSINGRLLNQSGGSLNIFGNVYTYSILENGDAGNAGTINIFHPGALYALGGTIENNHADSEINVETGGSLFNYYGTIDISTGGADSLDIKDGGKYDNIRGNHPGLFTISAGGNFLDFNEITLDRNLDIDFTWTITQVAVLHGNGNEIMFGADGAIVIEKDASLLLSEVVLSDVSGNKIHCTDNNSTLSIHNVIWTQDADFTYTKGQIHSSGDWLIQGADTAFVYESDQAFTVSADATVHMLLTTFKYNSDTNNLFTLDQATSIIHLEQATFQAVKACSLGTGRLFITGLGTLNGEATLDVQNLSNIDINGSFLRRGSVIL